MSSKKTQLKNKEYKYKAKLIRSFTRGFKSADGYDLRKISTWSPSRKAELTKVFNIVDSMLSGAPKHIYRPRNKSNLRPAQIASQQDRFSPKIMVAFMPVGNLDMPTRIRVRKKRVFVSSQGNYIGEVQSVEVINEGVKRRLINIDPVALARRTHEIIELTTKMYPSKIYAIQAGSHEVGLHKYRIPHNPTVDEIVKPLVELMNSYSATAYNDHDKNSSYYGNWLHGLVAYNFGPQRNYTNYLIAKEDEKLRIKMLRKDELRKRKRFFGRK